MFSIIEIIISILGFLGVLQNNFVLMIIGLIGIIVCDCIDIFVTKHNPTTIVLAILFAIGMSVATKNPLYSFTIALCIENLLVSAFTIILLVFSFFINIFHKKDNSSNTDDLIIKELMSKSNLSQQICTDIYHILIYLKNNNKTGAYNEIDSILIPHLIQENNSYNVAIAFGMLIDNEYGLTQEEANNYTNKTIKQILGLDLTNEIS